MFPVKMVMYCAKGALQMLLHAKGLTITEQVTKSCLSCLCIVLGNWHRTTCMSAASGLNLSLCTVSMDTHIHT